METKFNFNSQICTSREQSERLLALGLKKETADMMWWSHTVDWCGIINETERQWHLGIGYTEPLDARMERIPAWSLHRLLCLYNVHYLEFMGDTEIASAYDIVIDAIEMAINGGYFSEKYLV